MLDRGFLHSEQSLLGPEAINHLLDTFLAEVPDYLSRCLLEFGKQDYRRCAAQAHKLRGAARSVGLPGSASRSS
ncbi:MAG: Hpt domain-containing protein [Candidatus Competibacteraceae bacterium]